MGNDCSANYCTMYLDGPTEFVTADLKVISFHNFNIFDEIKGMVIRSNKSIQVIIGLLPHAYDENYKVVSMDSRK